jgi:FdhD protein
MTHKDKYSSIRSFTHTGGRILPVLSHLILEIPIEIIVNDRASTLIMFTPVMARELVTGFVYTEGLINEISDIDECLITPLGEEDDEQIIQARVKIPSIRSNLSEKKEVRTSYSSCGICGKDNYDDLQRGLGRVKSKKKFSMAILKRLPQTLERHQPLYKKTGGAHAALLLDSDGKLLVCAEDMGRHNAVDKVIGAALMKEISYHDKILVSSGRASLEMILKTARAGIPLFVAMSRPTSRAVQAAKLYNITLLDMAKDSNRIYSHVRRIEGF